MLVEHVYLSPHLDDAALSCGGRIHAQTSRGERVLIWTVCAGDPPLGEFSAFAQELHARWGVPARREVHLRRVEDLEACRRLGAEAYHDTMPDAIYRRHPLTDEPLYPTEASIFGTLHPAEHGRVEALAEALAAKIPPQARVYCPLTVGHHVDHQLVRKAVERWGRGQVEYYEDYPYVARPGALEPALIGSDWDSTLVSIEEADLEAKADAIAAYKSQINSFWSDLASMRQALRDFAQVISGGVVFAERYWARRNAV